MVKSEIVQVRMKPEIIKALSSIEKFAEFTSKSDTVRQLIYTGINFYKERSRKIEEVKEILRVFTIKPEELYPNIRYKRKHLSFEAWDKPQKVEVL